MAQGRTGVLKYKNPLPEGVRDELNVFQER